MFIIMEYNTYLINVIPSDSERIQNYPIKVDGLDGVIVASLPIGHLDVLGCLHHHLGEELGVCADQFAGHASGGRVDQTIVSQLVNLTGEK